MKFAVHVMPLKRPLGLISATPFNRKAPEPSHKYAVTAELGETVQDIVTKAEAQLQKLYGIDTAMTYFSRVRDAEGLDIAMTMKLGELMSESTPAAERSFTLYQDWLDNRDTLPTDSPLRPATSAKRRFEDLSVVEKQAFKVLKTAYEKNGDTVFMRAADGIRKPSGPDVQVVDSQASLPTPRNSSMPPPPTSAQRPPRSSPLDRAPQSSYDEDLLQTFSSNEEVAAELESEHNAFELMSSQQRAQMPPPQSSQRASGSIQRDVQTPQQPQQASKRSKGKAPIRPPRNAKLVPTIENSVAEPPEQPAPSNPATGPTESKTTPSSQRSTTTESFRPGRTGRTFTKICWKEEEDKLIGEGFAAGLTAERIRKRYKLDRTASAIRARKLVLLKNKPGLLRRALSASQGSFGAGSSHGLPAKNEVEEDEIEDEEEAFEPVKKRPVAERGVKGKGVEGEEEEEEEKEAERKSTPAAQEVAEETRDSDQDDPDSAVADLDAVQKLENDAEEVEAEPAAAAAIRHPEVVIPISFLGGSRHLVDEVREDGEEEGEEGEDVDGGLGGNEDGLLVEVEDEQDSRRSRSRTGVATGGLALDGADEEVDGHSEHGDDENEDGFGSEMRGEQPAGMTASVAINLPTQEEDDDNESKEAQNAQSSAPQQNDSDVVTSADDEEGEDHHPEPQTLSSEGAEDDLVRLAAQEGVQYYSEADGRTKLLRYLRPDMSPARIAALVRRVFRHAEEEVVEWHVRWLTVKRDLLIAAERGEESGGGSGGDGGEEGLRRVVEGMVFFRDRRREDYFRDDSLLPAGGGGAVVVPRTEPWEVVPKGGSGRVEEVVEEESGGVEEVFEEHEMPGLEERVGCAGSGSGASGLGTMKREGRAKSKRARRHAAAAAARRRRRDVQRV